MHLPPSVCVTVPQHDGLSLLRGGLGQGFKGPCRSGEKYSSGLHWGPLGRDYRRSDRGGEAGQGQASPALSVCVLLGVKRADHYPACTNKLSVFLFIERKPHGVPLSECA